MPERTLATPRQIQEIEHELSEANKMISTGLGVFLFGVAVLAGDTAVVNEIRSEAVSTIGMIGTVIAAGGVLILSGGELIKEDALAKAKTLKLGVKNNLFRGKIVSS